MTQSAHKTWWAAGLALAVLAGGLNAAHAQKKYGPGASDTEIKLGQTMPYSGPASAYSTIGKAEVAYFKMVNDEGGIAVEVVGESDPDKRTMRLPLSVVQVARKRPEKQIA